MTPGLAAHAKVPEDAYGVQASFKSPDADESAWEENASDLVQPDVEGNATLKVAIGDGAVQFGVRVVAHEGSPLCNETPDVTYQELDPIAYRGVNGERPWINPVNALT